MGVQFVVHGHFYQPPRENPWTEQVAPEPSAAPFHDWNERITAECYRANARARVVDDRGRVVALVDNYQHLSLDIGPSLLSWLEGHAPDVYGEMVEAPGAMAHAYSHSILPLATERDVRTQIKWGLADFRHRFRREPFGMWLPECAVSEEVLCILAEEGVRLTIVAPGQIEAVRDLAGGDWEDVPHAPDTSRPYRWIHPRNPSLSLDLAVYEGGLSHEVAFGLSMLTSGELIDKAAAAGDGLVLVATDGETFGHHHQWGERAVAYALTVEAERHGVETPRLVDALSATSPSHQARVRTSAWSCAHGVERWASDCGCVTGGQPGWDQEWRRPLRAAMDVIRESVDEVLDRRGPSLLKDPWAAREAYVGVILGAVSREDFVAAHVIGDQVEAFTLLEAARNGQAMYTSCGWFFSDIAGLEAIQVMRYAARTIDLLAELGEGPGDRPVTEVLRGALSNVTAEGTGADVWRNHVVPARVPPVRVVAHLALTTLLTGRQAEGTIAVWEVVDGRAEYRRRGVLAVVAGRVSLRHRRTGRATEHAYAGLLLGGLDVLGSVRNAGDVETDDNEIDTVVDLFKSGARVTQMLREISQRFGPEEFGLDASLPGMAEDLLAEVADELSADFAEELQRLVDRHRPTVDALLDAGHPLPADVRRTAGLALGRRLELIVAAQQGSTEVEDYGEAVALAQSALALNVDLDVPQAHELLGDLLAEAVGKAVEVDDSEASAAAAAFAIGVVNLASDLGIGLNLEPVQETVYQALVARPGARPELTRLGDALHLATDHLGEP